MLLARELWELLFTSEYPVEGEIDL
jgi:hypothetical protein